MSGGILKRRPVLLAAAGVTAVSLAALAPYLGGIDLRGPLRIATGGRGGVYFRLGEGLARVVREQYSELKPEILTTAASAANLQLVDAGRAEVGFTQADIVIGSGINAPVALARLHDDYLHLVVRADGRLQSVDDLRGSRVSLGSHGSGTEVIARRLLTAAGLGKESDMVNVPLGVDEAASALAARRVAAFFFSGGLPVSAVERLAHTIPIKLLNLSQYVGELRHRYGEVYSEWSIPASTYRVGPTATIGVPNYLITSPRLPNATAYALAELLMESRESLAVSHSAAKGFNRRSAISTGQIHLHPGAVQYFRNSQP